MKLKIFFSIILVFLLGGLVFRQSLLVKSTNAHGKKEVWYCPMHTYYRTDKPGKCPICGMDLVKEEEEHQSQHQKAGQIPEHVAIKLPLEKQQLIGVRTAIVSKQNLRKMVRAAGYISTNNELYKLQDEYVRNYMDFITVYRDAKRFEHTRRNWEAHRELQLKLHDLEDKLLALGLDFKQMKELQKFSWTTPWNQPSLLFLNDTFKYWAVAQIFEEDLRFIKVGQEAEIDIPDVGQKFKGIVRSVGGVIDPQTRTASALIEINDKDEPLKGNMFVNVNLVVNLKDKVAIPAQAVMDTGLRKIVFVQTQQGQFEPREIQTGMKTDDRDEIISGLKEGETIAVSGNFLLDSESRIQASLQSGGQS